MSIEQPGRKHNSLDYEILSRIEQEEHSPLARHLKDFDIHRKSAYEHVRQIMMGSGGKNSEEALKLLETYIAIASKDFGNVSVNYIDEYGESQETAHVLASLYKNDENERLKILSYLNSDTTYKAIHLEALNTYFSQILEVDQTDEYNDVDDEQEDYVYDYVPDDALESNEAVLSSEDRQEALEYFYENSMRTDILECIQDAPENRNEKLDNEMRALKDKIRNFATDTSKIAAGSLIALFLTNKWRKKH